MREHGAARGTFKATLPKQKRLPNASAAPKFATFSLG
jgi:hypothetical protein